MLIKKTETKTHVTRITNILINTYLINVYENLQKSHLKKKQIFYALLLYRRTLSLETLHGRCISASVYYSIEQDVYCQDQIQ